MRARDAADPADFRRQKAGATDGLGLFPAAARGPWMGEHAYVTRIEPTKKALNRALRGFVG